MNDQKIRAISLSIYQNFVEKRIIPDVFHITFDTWVTWVEPAIRKALYDNKVP